MLVADDLWQNSKFKREKSVKLLLKIYQNIKQNPNEAKYRKLNMSKISSKPGILPQVRQILLCSGFVANVNGIHFDLSDGNLNLCVSVGEMFEDRVNDEIIALEKERKRIRQQAKAKEEEYLSKNNKKKEQIKKLIDSDKKDKAQEIKPKISSKAKKLNFGRTDVAVEFSTGGGG